MDKFFDDIIKFAEKYPQGALLLTGLFGLYMIGQLEIKRGNLSPTPPKKGKEEIEVNWKEIALAQSENVRDLIKLVNGLVEERKNDDE